MKPKLTSRPPAFVSRSRETGTDYPIYIDAPETGTRRGPLTGVVFMDGDFVFDMAVSAARELQAAGKIPATAIIAVGYGASFGQPGNLRGRDYTPTASADEPGSGGADPFVDYLTGQLWPELEERLRLDASRRIIAGHSLGSLLVLHAFFQAKPFFQGALASAPSIWWDNRSVLGLIARLRRRRRSLPGHLYLGVGLEETPSMTGDLSLLERQLQEQPFDGLRITTERLPGLDHYSSLPASLRAGLASLLG